MKTKRKANKTRKRRTSKTYQREFYPPGPFPDLSPFLCIGDTLRLNPDARLVQGDWCWAVVSHRSIGQVDPTRCGVFGRAYCIGEKLLVYMGRDERTERVMFDYAESAERVDRITDSSGRSRLANGANGDSRDRFEVAVALVQSHWTKQAELRRESRTLAAKLGRVYLRERRWMRLHDATPAAGR
jgi:hypothetical protein